MKVTIESVKFNADQKLVDFVNQKVKKLSQFHERIIAADVYLKLDANQEVGNKITEIKLEMPGGELFSKKQCKTFEEATDQAVDALKIQIQKYKEKLKH
jgi:putative sigma-54 modulation protein